MMKKMRLCSLICLFCLPLCLSAQEVKEKKDTTKKVELTFEMVMEALDNQAKEAADRVKEELAAGAEAPDFEYPNPKGKMYSLKNFKGKYVFIDVWATWCGPCCKEIPYLKELEKKMAKKKIVFVSLSCDENHGKWVKMVKKDKLKGVQLCMGKDMTFRQVYGITSIPRFILLDKEGKIVNAMMTPPSDPQTVKTLLALPGI